MLIGAVFAVSGNSIIALRLVQSVLSLLAVALIYDTCRARFGERAAFGSALACAMSPGLAHFAHFLWAETLFTTLFVLFLWFIRRFDLSGNVANLVGAALALALAALTKEIVVFMSLLLLPWFVVRVRHEWRTGVGHAVIFLLCFVIPIAPWAVRNRAVHGQFVGLSTCRWFPIAVGNLRAEDETHGTAKRQEFLSTWRGMTDEVEKEQLSREAALETIRLQQPWWILKKVEMTALRLFSPKGQEIRFLELGRYPRNMGPWAIRGHVLTSLIGHIVLLTPGLLALWLVRDDPLRWILLVTIGYSLAVYTVANSTPRFLIPLLPLFYFYIGPMLTGAHREAKRWQWAGALITVLLFLVVVLSQVEALGPAWNAFGRR
jgi:4-amino-4-deoxy-L-arabinose transferase-like glycosyltransferase